MATKHFDECSYYILKEIEVAKPLIAALCTSFVEAIQLEGVQGDAMYIFPLHYFSLLRTDYIK